MFDLIKPKPKYKVSGRIKSRFYSAMGDSWIYLLTDSQNLDGQYIREEKIHTRKGVNV